MSNNITYKTILAAAIKGFNDIQSSLNDFGVLAKPSKGESNTITNVASLDTIITTINTNLFSLFDGESFIEDSNIKTINKIDSSNISIGEATNNELAITSKTGNLTPKIDTGGSYRLDKRFFRKTS